MTVHVGRESVEKRLTELKKTLSCFDSLYPADQRWLFDLVIHHRQALNDIDKHERLLEGQLLRQLGRCALALNYNPETK